MNNKRFVVVCYAVHNKNIASHDTFKTEEEAWDFLQKDAKNTYDEEMNNANEEMKDAIDLGIDESDYTAYLTSYNGEYDWTWEIIEIEV